MKYYLVNKLDEIVDKVDMSDVGVNGAKTYFVGRKKIDEESFDKLWKVMSQEQYHRHMELANREGKQYEWWKDEPKGPDDEFDY